MSVARFAGDDLSLIQTHIGGMLLKLSPVERTRATMVIAKYLRTTNAQRIKANIQPDGSAMVPRKPRVERKAALNKVRKKRDAMFQRLANYKWLKPSATFEEARIAFQGSAARIARVSQYGLRDKIEPKMSVTAQYPVRKLLGFAPQDELMIMDIMLAHLGGEPLPEVVS